MAKNKLTRAEVDSENQTLRMQLSTTEICLSALADGRVQWIGGKGAARKPHTVALVKPESASGGYVIHVYRAPGQSAMVSCVLLDDFDRQTRISAAYSGDQEEAAYVRELCHQALMIRNAVLHDMAQADRIAS